MKPKKNTRYTLIFFCVLIVACSLFADDKTERVDKIFTFWDKPDSPGCALAIIKDGEIIYKRGYGMANLEHNIPITPKSMFYIGSVSKQFVAMCVALLVQEEKLSLDDDIRKYIPELRDYGTPITIRHLIHHTSGIRDYLTLEDIAGIPFGFYHEKDVLDLIVRQKELNFHPGDEYLYSNSGYFLISVIIHRASGKSLRQYAYDKIFKPLGMKNSRFHDNYEELIKNRASGYLSEGGGKFKNFISTFDCVGSGGLFTSVEDLYLWDQNFYHHKLGGKEVFDLMHTVGTLNNGIKLDYAFALEIKSYKGLKAVGHGGALGGYKSSLFRFPEKNFSVIILSNLSSFNPSLFSSRVADVYLSEHFTEEKEKPTKIQEVGKRPQTDISSNVEVPRDKQLSEYQGRFFSEELQVTFEIRLEEGKLHFVHKMASQIPLKPLYMDLFQFESMRVHFVRNEEKKITGFLLDTDRVRNLRFIKLL